MVRSDKAVNLLKGFTEAFPDFMAGVQALVKNVIRPISHVT